MNMVSRWNMGQRAVARVREILRCAQDDGCARNSRSVFGASDGFVRAQDDARDPVEFTVGRGSQVALLVAAFLALGVASAHAQGSRKDDIVFNAQGRPMAGATVRVCTATATGQPCTPLANIYSDPGLTQALANPMTTDGLGNYSFYAAPGRYEIEIDGPGISTKQLPNVILPSDPSNPTFATLSTTSGISAFSLTLGGNLTVSGSAAVTGTLSVGGAPVPATTQANTWTASQTFQGPTPWVDAGAFAARAIVTTSYTTTCTASASSTALTCASAAQFHNGDGISLYGAGATNTLATPSTPTVTPSLAAHATGTGVDVNATAGSSSFSYKVVALGSWSATPANNLWGAYTAASTAGATATGNALGSQTQTISTLSEQNGLLTITCSASCPMSQGAYVDVAGTSNDNFFAGQYVVASVTNTTTFTVYTGNSTSAVTTATGGTLGWFACNHITWSAVTGAFEYAIYGRTSGAWTLLGFSVPGTTWFDDFGSTMTANVLGYGWLPTTAPSSGQNGVLTTTVTAGGGSTNLTVASAATNAVTSGFATFDDAPLLASAISYAVTNGGPLFIPCNSSTAGTRFIVGSYLQFPGAHGLNVQQCGSLWLDAPLEWNANLNWFGGATGNNETAASVALVANAEIDVDTAYPGIYSPNATSMFVDHTFLNQYPGTNMALLSYLTNGGPGIVWQNSTWQTGGTNGNNDYMGVHLILGPNNAQPDNTFTNDSWVSGPTQAPNLTTTPLVIMQAVGEIHFDNCSLNRRTFAEVGVSLGLRVSKGCWLQGPITPFIMSNASSVAIGGAYVEGVNMDTSFQPIFANWSSGVLNGTVEIANDGFTGPQVVTGTGVGNLIVSRNGARQAYGPDTLGQTKNYLMPGAIAYVEFSGATQGAQSSISEMSGPNYQAQPNPSNFFIEQIAAPPTTTQSSGGTLTGTHSYGIVAHFHNGTSRTSAAGNSVTMSGGNGTTVTTWTAVPGAVSYDVWDLTRGLPTACVALTATTCTDNGGIISASGPEPNAPSDGYPSMTPAGIYAPAAAFASMNLTNLLLSSTAPTISSGFGTGASITANNGPAAFAVNVGTGGAANSGVIAMPTATAGWNCVVNNITAKNSNRADNTVQTASTTTTVSVQNQTTSSGAALAWTASDTLRLMCLAY